VHVAVGNNATFGNYGANATQIRGCKIQGNLYGVQVGNDATISRFPDRWMIVDTHFSGNTGCELGGTTNPRDIRIIQGGNGRIDNITVETSPSKTDHISILVGDTANTNARTACTLITNSQIGGNNGTLIKLDNDEDTLIVNTALSCPSGTKLIRTANSYNLSVVNTQQRIAENNRNIIDAGDYSAQGESDTNQLINGDFLSWGWIGNVTNSCPVGWFCTNANTTISRETDVPITSVGKYSVKVLAGDDVLTQFYQPVAVKPKATYTIEFAIKSDVAVTFRPASMVPSTIAIPSTSDAWKFYVIQTSRDSATGANSEFRFDLPINSNGKYFQLAYVRMTEGKTIRGGYQPSIDAIIYPMSFAVDGHVDTAAATYVISQFYLYQRTKVVRIDSYFATPYVVGGGTSCILKVQRYNGGAWSDVAACPLTTATAYNYETFEDGAASAGWIPEEDPTGGGEGNYRLVAVVTGIIGTAPADGTVIVHVMYDPRQNKVTY
jgi:hypothetical protein